MTRLVGPGIVVTMAAQGVLPHGGVAVEGGRITRVDDWERLRSLYPQADLVGTRGGVIMPGLTNAHTHLYGLFARGFGFPGPAPRSFRQILEQVWWKLDKELTTAAVRVSALYGLGESLKMGVTAVNDHHSSPGAAAGSLGEIAGAATTLGVRTCLAYEVSDRNGLEAMRAGVAENVRFIGSLSAGAAGARPPDGCAPEGGSADAGDRMLAARFGLHASFTLSAETLALCRATAESVGVGVHIHLAEGPEDQADSLLKYGRRVTHRLAAAGVLKPSAFVGHGVHLDDEEIALLAESGAVLTHQPQSNMGNAVGWPRILSMRERGVRVALGTDGYSNDMLETLRAAALLHSHSVRTPSAGIAECADVLLVDNPRIMSGLFGVTLGRLEPGAAADLLVTDYHPPTPLTGENARYHLFYGLSAAHINTVLVAGRVVVREHRLTSIDEKSLAREAREVAAHVWAKL